MKRFTLYSIVLLIGTMMTAWVAGAAVSNMKDTKHDLSYRETDPPIHSSNLGATEICAFCHTPHSATKDAPLWNRSDVSGPYDVYNSDVMAALNYPSPDQPTTKLGAGSADVHVKTRICLSCHDGTIALGNLVNLPSGISSEIMMSGTTADYKMPGPAEGYIGLDLRDDHPVAVQYRGIGTGAGEDPELKASPSAAQLTLYTSGGVNYVECTSCHDPHKNDNGNFLVMANTNSALCTGCHNKTGYEPTSAHAAAVQAYSPTDGTPAGTLGTTVGTVKCMTCHFPHKSAVTYDDPTNPNPRSNNYLLSYQEEASCFIYNSAAPGQTDRWNTASAAGACHSTASSVSTRIIQDLTGGSGNAGKQYGHHVGSFSGVHAATEDRNTSMPGNANTNWVNTAPFGWHVECQDCHNAHTAGTTVHTPPTNSVAAGSPLYGAGGESLTAAPTWPNGIGAYGYLEPLGLLSTANTAVQKEYQVCLKCHSDFAWGVNPPDSPSLGGGIKMTNQAMEFGSGSSSYHPVVNATGRTLGTIDTANFAWTTPLGGNLMYCSDCHSSDGNLTPKGPHGSSNQGMLAWPSNGSQYGQINGASQASTDLCLRCHAASKYNTSAANDTSGGTGFTRASGVNMHNRHNFLQSGGSGLPNRRAYKCVNCHARVAHGMNRKALIVYRGDGAAYEAEGLNTGLINNGATPLPAPGSYVKTSCSSYSANGVTGCHD